MNQGTSHSGGKLTGASMRAKFPARCSGSLGSASFGVEPAGWACLVGMVGRQQFLEEHLIADAVERIDPAEAFVDVLRLMLMKDTIACLLLLHDLGEGALQLLLELRPSCFFLVERSSSSAK